MSPSHRLQFSTNCPSVGPSHGVPSFRNRLLHGVTSSASKPALAWASLSTGPQVLEGSCSSAGSPWVHSLFWASTCSGVGSLPRGCRWISAPPGTSMDLRGTACLTMVFSTGCRGTSALAPGAPPHPPSCLTVVSAEFAHPAPAAKLRRFFSFLNVLSQRFYHRCWARPWPAAGLSWSRLALALSDMVEASGSFSQKPRL